MAVVNTTIHFLALILIYLNNHKLLITKLKAYGLDSNSLTFMKEYLTNRLQRCKINNSFSGWEKVLKGVPQGSILGPLLFNIFINDIFLSLQKCDLANYADDKYLVYI